MCAAEAWKQRCEGQLPPGSGGGRAVGGSARRREEAQARGARVERGGRGGIYLVDQMGPSGRKESKHEQAQREPQVAVGHASRRPPWSVKYSEAVLLVHGTQKPVLTPPAPQPVRYFPLLHVNRSYHV